MVRRDGAVHFADEVPEGYFQAHRQYVVSTDSRRVLGGLHGTRPHKRVRGLDDLGDVYGDLTPVPDDAGGDDSAVIHAVADTVTSYDVCPDEEETTGKRKRYTSSDTPMQLWRPLASQYLDVLLRHEGLGNSLFNPGCGCCGAEYVLGRGDGDGDVRLFQCDQCGPFLQCQGCLLDRHTLSPLHSIKEWNGRHWIEARLSGRPGTLGLVYQVGHDGHPCEFPGRDRSMVVMDVTGIHTITMRFCGCEKAARAPLGTVGQLLANRWYPATTIDPQTCATLEALEFYRMLSVVGNMNVHDFVGSLERKMDPLCTSSVLDQYKVFGRMSRQYNFLQRAKRAGLGHTSDGLERAEPGSLVVLCWACPHDKKNLPEEWRDVEPKYRFLYALLLVMDANFRLKNRLRANEHQDPSLGSGLGYFVEEKAYKAHVKNYVAEKDVSSCIAFTALMQKETRMTSGLWCSGDLQKGERYANMDYILLSSLIGVTLLLLVLSYNIACQWKINLVLCAEKIKETTNLLTRLDEYEIVLALPVWHAAAHEVECQTQYSLSYTEGVGRTDSEGIERTWAVLNPLGFSTKEMGNGAQHDAIEDKVDHLNFEKNVGQGDTLAQKLIVAIAERDKQVAVFVQVDSTLHKRLRKKWQDRIDAWLADRSQPNPYCLAGGKNAGPNEAAVLQELKEAEALEVAEGREVFADTKSTPVSFIKAGLVLEESQQRMKAELKGVMLVTADRSSQIQEMRLSFLRKLHVFERMQVVFMPGVSALKAATEELRDVDAPPLKAEEIKLWLPSELTVAAWRTACRKGLGEVEAKSRLHAQTHLIMWRNSNSTGQRGATQSATLIGRVGDRIARVASKYRHARSALMELKGADFAPHFKVLEAADLNTNVDNETLGGPAKKNKASANDSEDPEEAVTTKRFSWIWTMGGGPGEDTEQLHNSVRVEWSKAKARRDRWVEEVQLLREEMKRVLRMLRWTSQRWASCVSGQENVDPERHAGLAAYARRQIYVHRRIAEHFEQDWRGSMAVAVQHVVERDGQIYRELLDSTGVDQLSRPVGGSNDRISNSRVVHTSLLSNIDGLLRASTSGRISVTQRKWAYISSPRGPTIFPKSSLFKIMLLILVFNSSGDSSASTGAGHFFANAFINSDHQVFSAAVNFPHHLSAAVPGLDPSRNVWFLPACVAAESL
ncbi:hypothetical protein K438DRAFT_1956654 [Mycena galopus ATCC 62051]|nr:hypothetical protein K438DRAFT_1956654 [Mycena galopus ATCC 62051]